MLKKIFSIILIISALLMNGCTSTQSKEKQKKELSKEEKEEVYSIIRGISLAENNKTEEALSAFKEAYKINPKNQKAVKFIALCYSKLGDIENGRKYFEEALKIDKYEAETLYNYAILEYSQNNYIKAKELLERVKIENIDRKIIMAKGYVYFKLEMNQESINEFSKIINDGTEYSIDVYKTYVELLKRNNKNGEIYNFVYNLYIKQNNNIEKLNLLSTYLREVKAFDTAEEFIKNYARENGYSKVVLISLGELMIEKEDFGQAKTYLELLENKYSMETDVLKFKIVYFEKLGLKEQAEEIKKILNSTSENKK